MVMHNKRGHARPVAFCDVRHRYIPAHTSIFGVQRDQVSIGRQKVKIVFVHRDATMPNVFARTARMNVMPDYMSGTCIDGPNIFRNCEINNSIDDEWRRLIRMVLFVWKAQASVRASTFCGVIWDKEL